MFFLFVVSFKKSRLCHCTCLSVLSNTSIASEIGLSELAGNVNENDFDRNDVPVTDEKKILEEDE